MHLSRLPHLPPPPPPPPVQIGACLFDFAIRMNSSYTKMNNKGNSVTQMTKVTACECSDLPSLQAASVCGGGGVGGGGDAESSLLGLWSIKNKSPLDTASNFLVCKYCFKNYNQTNKRLIEIRTLQIHFIYLFP